ncbi:MAG: OmpA family protein [Deltaproteobacteria bacterium]|nr:OmpA family protein [Deltaproteobacteria bacterium]
MAKHVEHEEHENHERWLVSYADFITLLFAFFVVMYSISSVDQTRAIQVEQAVKWALHMVGKGGGGTSVVSGPLTVAPDVTNQGVVIERLRLRIEERLRATGVGVARPSLMVIAEGNRLTVRLSAMELYDEAEAIPRPSMLPTLDTVLAELARYSGTLSVEGHADQAGRTKNGVDPNWELSARRAAAVAAYADATHAVPPERIRAVGYGATRPIATQATAEGRRQNRRLELVLELDAPTTKEIIDPTRPPDPLNRYDAPRSDDPARK